MPSFDARIEAVRRVLPVPLFALFAPDLGMEGVARAGRLRWTFAIALACSLLAGASAALRVDARDSTLFALEKRGELKAMSDRQVEDAQKGNERTFEVSRLALAAVEPPVSLALSLAGLLALSWFLRGKPKASPLFAVCGVGLLPGALADLLDAVAALRHEVVPPEALQHLSPRHLADFAATVGHPLAGAAAKLGSAVDLYSLWGAVLLGYGLAASASLPVRRAVPAALIGWLLFRLLTHVAVPTSPGG
ncbi:MAG TPA: hypothetical protein VN883_07720 [Myxococcales bacterium]|nr:hypothetical protein [Myxococcales bacterium]